MAISDTKLRTIYGKPYSGPQEVADADGLSVRISPKGVIQFQYRYRWHGKPNRLGLGRYPSLSLKDARQITADLRKLYFSGTDPRTYFEEKVENFHDGRPVSRLLVRQLRLYNSQRKDPGTLPINGYEAHA